MFSTVLLKGDSSPHSLDPEWIIQLYQESLKVHVGGSSVSVNSISSETASGSNLDIGPRRVAFLKHFLNRLS